MTGLATRRNGHSAGPGPRAGMAAAVAACRRAARPGGVGQAARHPTLVPAPAAASGRSTASPALALRHDDGFVEAYDLVALVTLDSLKALACSPIRPLRAYGAMLLHPASSQPLPVSAEAQFVESLLAAGMVPRLSGLASTDREPSNVSMTSSSCPSAPSVSGSDDELEAAFAAPAVVAARKRRRVQTKIAWTRQEDAAIEEGVQKFGCRWARIAVTLPVGRSDDAVRNRWHRLQRKQQKKGRCSLSCSDLDSAFLPPLVADGPKGPSEAASSIDSTVSSLLLDVGSPDLSSLDEADRHGDMWTPEEDRIIDHAVRFQDLRWKAIAALLPGRTDSGCRNRWVRNQQRVLSAMGSPAKGTADVLAALRSCDSMRAPIFPGPVEFAFARISGGW